MMSVEFAEKIFAGSFLGPRQIRRVCPNRIEVVAEETLPFTEQELKLAAPEHDLVFEPKGKTMRQICEAFGHKTSLGTPLLRNKKKCEDEQFFNADRLVGGWYLVARNLIPDSKGRNFWDHTEIIANHFRRVFDDHAPKISNPLKPLRPRPVQMFWHMVVSERLNNGRRIMEDSAGLASGVNSNKQSICMGLFGPTGIAVGFLPTKAHCEEYSRIGIPFAYGGKCALI